MSNPNETKLLRTWSILRSLKVFLFKKYAIVSHLGIRTRRGIRYFLKGTPYRRRRISELIEFLNIWVWRETESWYPIQNWPKTDTKTALASNKIIVEFLFIGFLFPFESVYSLTFHSLYKNNVCRRIWWKPVIWWMVLFDYTFFGDFKHLLGWGTGWTL